MINKKRTVVISLTVMLLAIGLIGAVIVRGSGKREIVETNDSVSLWCEEPQPTPLPASAPAPAPASAPTPTPSPVPDEASLAQRQAAQLEKLEEIFCRDGKKPSFQVFPRKAAGAFVQYGGVFTIGVPEHWDEGEVDLVLFFDPDALPYRGRSYYGGEVDNPFVCAEDRIDCVMDENPDAVVVMMSCQWGGTYMLKMLDAVDRLGVQAYRRVVSAGWSAGGNRALSCAAEILEKYPDMGVPLILLNDCNHTELVEATVFNTLAEHEVKCLLFTSNVQGARGHKLYGLMRRQIPIAIVYAEFELQPESNMHIDRLYLGFAENLLGYVLGNIPELPAETYGAQYRYGYHDYEKDTTVYLTAAEVYRLLEQPAAQHEPKK